MIRFYLLLTVLGVIQAGTLYIRAGFTPPTIASAEKTIAKIPQTVGQWTSTDVELDPKVYAAIGASDTLDRRYSNSYGSQVLVHCAGWNDGEEWMPHPPPGCYSTAGWEIKKQHSISLESFPTSRVCLMELERSGERIQALYWFQRGGLTYHDREGARAARQKLWGKPEWPPLVKVLLQTSAVDSKAAEKQLLAVAAQIMNSINEESR